MTKMISTIQSGFIAFLCLTCVALSSDAFPQTADEQALETQTPSTVQTAPAAQTVPSRNPATTLPSVDLPKIDLTDPAIKAALDAREDADRALVDAVLKAQSDAATADVPAAADDMPAKPSIIPKNADEAKALGQKILSKVIGWLTSPSFLAQIGAIALVWFLAPILTKSLTKRVFLFRDPPTKDAKLRVARDYIYRSRDFLRAALQVGLLALFAVILKNIEPLGQDWLVKIAQGLAVVFLLYSVIKTFITNEMFQKLAIWILIPLALLVVFGFYDDLTNWLNNLKFGQGEGAISAMTLVMLAIFGAVFFKIATYSNAKGQDAIRSQEALDVTTREVIAKIFQIVIFVAATMMAFTAAGISLSGLVVIFSALSLGIGLGLQPIAANFVSGMIILFDRSVKVGDFVNMEGDQFGRVKAINMRSTVVATADGKDIIVPNTAFTEGAYENWTHDDPLQRYEVDFTVAYNSDLDYVVEVIGKAVLAHKDVLGEPDLPSVEFRSFGESGINMCVEFWCEGVDDGPNKFTSDVGFIVWRTLKDNGISIPFPQREVRMLVDRSKTAKRVAPSKTKSVKAKSVEAK
ncbi:mechanosensitive ion channel family protein [Fretibacter rubidus]|uniref:mechanosensitive ion channel family protein n=1 Tax=Fretibacter rubidus TaxID=570162 RepID=UPI00352B239D